MESRANPTLTRRRQRRPDLQTTFDIPEDLQQLISRVRHTLLDGAAVGHVDTAAVASKAVSVADKALQELLQSSLTPAQQLHAISKVTGALKDIPKAQLGALLTTPGGALYTWGRGLALEAVVPLLLDCRVRYLHRALMTLLRTLLPSPPDAAVESAVREMYVARVLRRSAGKATSLALGGETDLLPAAAAARYFPTGMDGSSDAGSSSSSNSSASASRDAVLNFLNAVDGLTSTLMPMMPAVFRDTFVEVLPLLAASFQWVVANATSRSRAEAGTTDEKSTAAAATAADTLDNNEEGLEGEEGENVVEQQLDDDTQPSGVVSGTVFGEDLEHIRFCVRVVATYIHKYMDSLTLAMASGTAGVEVSRQLARLLQPTVVMLSSPIFPKDVLNAVGLLVASILTVRTCDRWLLSAVCAALRDDVAAAAHAIADTSSTTATTGESGAATATSAAASLSLAELFARADLTLAVVCAAEPRTAAEAHHGAGAAALHDLFTAFTPNGCFALLKGVLAHVSSPIRGDWLSFGLLLTPHAVGEGGAGEAREEVVVAFDVILTAAQYFCNLVQEPETRFMAIQTIDSVVRHVSAVVSTAAAALTKTVDGASGKQAPMEEAVRQHLATLCVATDRLRSTLDFATQLIMALWDDGTQQMSGALYGTYNEILKIHAALHRCGAAPASPAGDTAITLEQILEVQAERRGKYHALLGHLSMMPLPSFLAALQRHYHGESAAAAAVSDAVAAFSRMLLSGASNHKIGNVAGDVFAQLARAIKGASEPMKAAGLGGESVADVLQTGIVTPLARAMTEKDYVGVSSNVSAAVNISHITAHFVAPLVKHEAAFLPFILSAVVQRSHGGAVHECERMEQGVVEVLSRARGAGVDIVPYLTPGSTVLRVLEASMHSLNYEVRNSALCLCVLGTRRLQAVQAWQLQKVEEYVVLNMHLGGDSTARKGLLEMLKKWVRRLAESYASKGAASTAASANGADATTSKKAAKKARKEEEKVEEALQQSSGTAVDTVQLGTAAYRHAVLQHCQHLADIFAQNIGRDLRSAEGLAVERRVTAMMGYVLLLQGVRLSLPCESMQSLLHPSVVPALLATLSDGWSQARESARELLDLLCTVAPNDVFAEAGAVNAEANSSPSAVAAALVERAHLDLLKAQTYRNAEGAVQRFLLFSTRSPAAQAHAREQPAEEVARLKAMLEAERQAVEEKCAAMSAMRGGAAYAFIQANPLHGSLSLCAELLTCMSGAVAAQQVAPLPSRLGGDDAGAVAVAPTSSGTVLTDACTNLLRCCCVVLRTCSALVGTETVTTGATAGLGEHEVVDCRGHVYDRSRPEAESVMRGVVNNTWLSMRVATSAIGVLLKVRAVHLLPFDAVRSAAYELVHALLLTKHNGVMRCVREALKALTATLVRSRAPHFYQLPAELLGYLLGPEGVTSGDMARMLRRSQGLPHAILAVLEAEDTAVPYSLFPVAMRQLTRVARGDIPLGDTAVTAFSNLGSTADDVRRSQRSNALNVLKFIFEDKVFADRVVAYIEEAFSLATEGFHDASWYTRNSSLMLFSAVIHRFVGEHPSTGGAGINTSLHDVAKRTPRGVAYAYAELTRGDGLESGAGNASSAAASPEVNVALFPVLQLLSMLSPDPPHLITKASHGTFDDTARMSAAVARCAASPSLMVRSASAVALCCLVPIASLTLVIRQTRRGLSLGRQEAVAEEFSRATGEEQTRADTGVAGGFNACHGALLQLLQFHAQYIGTSRRHYKQKRSSYATAAVAAAVCHAICEVVLSCADVLAQSCAVCPTVAATLFALLADLVYYGPQQHLPGAQQQALRALCVASLEAYALSSQGVLERGSVMENASAVVVFMAAQQRRTSTASAGAWSPEERRRLSEVLRCESAVLDVRSGEHNLISWIAAQLIHYGDGSAALLDGAAVVDVLQVLLEEGGCDVATLVFRSLAAFFTADGIAAKRIGCISWGQLVTHLRFAAIATTHATASAAASAENTSTVRELYETAVRRLSPSGSDGAPTSCIALSQNSDVCSAALDFVASYDIHVSGTHTISPQVASLLTFYAAPEQPLESRLAVVKALRTAQPFLRRSVADPARTGPSSESAVTLLLVLLRLLVDDTSSIREAASTICSHCLWGTEEAPRDQVSCLLALARLLRQLCAAGQLDRASGMRALLSIVGNETSPVAGAEGDAESDDDGDGEEADDEEDVLFQKEAANMFAEETVVLCLCGYIFGAEGSESVAAACRSFSVFDSQLS